MAFASFRGDLGKLKELESRFMRLTEHAWKQETNRQLSEEALSRVLKGFDDQRAPDGTAWAPLKHPRRRGGDQALRDTGRLMNSIRPKYSSASFGLVAPVIYAATHQWGRGPIPARPFLPEPPFPAAYQQAFIGVFSERAYAALGVR